MIRPAGLMSAMHRARTWVVALFILAMTPVAAAALCVDPPEDGAWVNADPNTSGISRIQLTFVCQDVILNGERYPPGPPWYMRLHGKCHPNDCDWGRVGATDLSSGQIHAIFDQGFARRYVWAAMSQYRRGQLWVYVWTDFADPNRADYGMHEWFRQ